MKTDGVVDYSMHYQELKHMIKNLYDLLNDREFDKADELSLRMIAETKLLNNSIRSIQASQKW